MPENPITTVVMGAGLLLSSPITSIAAPLVKTFQVWQESEELVVSW
jgi:hypothetical protein